MSILPPSLSRQRSYRVFLTRCGKELEGSASPSAPARLQSQLRVVLGDSDAVICGDVPEGLHLAARPGQFQHVDLRGTAEAKVRAEVTRGDIAIPTLDFADLRLP